MAKSTELRLTWILWQRAHGVQTDLESVVGPRTQLHGADLVVEGEVGDVYLTRGVELDDGRPKDVAIMTHHGQRRHVAVRVVFDTAIRHSDRTWRDNAM